MFAEADTSQGFQIIVDTCLFFEIIRTDASNVVNLFHHVGATTFTHSQS